MNRQVLWMNIHVRYINALMLFVYGSSMPIPAQRYWLAACSGLSLLVALAMHVHVRRTGRLRQAVVTMLWLDLLTTWPAVALTGLVASPFVAVLVLNIHTMYFVEFNLATAKRFGWTGAAWLIVLGAIWWTHGRPGSGWDPARYAGWTLIVFLIQVSAFLTALTQVQVLSDPLHQELERQERALADQQRRAELGAALSMITHEIRTPLTTILGSLSLAELSMDRVPDPAVREPAQTRVREATAETLRLNELLESVLSYAREKRGRYVFEPCECRAIVERAVGFIRLKHGRAGVKLAVDFLPSDVPEIECDRDAMHQVLVNLLENAVQHRHPARPLRIELAMHREEAGCRLTLADNGSGIPPQVREHVFGQFVTGRPGGTGLGLAIVRQIMTDHGGSVAVEHSSEDGTTFALRLPQRTKG